MKKVPLQFSREKMVFTRKMLGPQDIYKNKSNLDSYLTLYTKFNNKRAIDLNVKGTTIRLPVSTEEYFHDTKASKNFLNKTQKALT